MMITMPRIQRRFCLKPLSFVVLSIGLAACSGPSPSQKSVAGEATSTTANSTQNAEMIAPNTSDKTQGKPVVYQVFTRLFGNTNNANHPWGSIEQNGVGKFSDFTPQALAAIKALGLSLIHI